MRGWPLRVTFLMVRFWTFGAVSLGSLSWRVMFSRVMSERVVWLGLPSEGAEGAEGAVEVGEGEVADD